MAQTRLRQPGLRPPRTRRATDSPGARLRAFYDGHADDEWVSSALLRIELTRAVARAVPALLPEARELLTAFSYIAIDDEIVDGAIRSQTADFGLLT